MQYLKNNNGFSFVELLVAFSIVAMTLVGMFSLFIKTLEVERVNRDQLMASMLAQEGLELVRAKRDSNWLNANWPATITSWDGLTGDTDPSTDLDVDTSPHNFIADTTIDFSIGESPDTTCSDIDNACAIITRDMLNDRLIHGAGDATVYSRMLTVTGTAVDIDTNGAGDYIEVQSRVKWSSKGQDKTYIAETILYDWR